MTTVKLFLGKSAEVLTRGGRTGVSTGAVKKTGLCHGASEGLTRARRQG